MPLVIPLAWIMMAWPAWLVARRLTRGRGRAARVAVGAVALASWDLFLDPQMVAEGYWRWHDPVPALPGVPGIPVGTYLGWLGFALLLMTALSVASRVSEPAAGDTPMYALWIWTWASSVLAHAVFLGLPASAVWGGVLMGAAVLPLVVTLRREFRNDPIRTDILA